MSNFILAAEYVTDTIGLIIYLENRKLGADSQQIFNSAELGNQKRIRLLPTYEMFSNFFSNFQTLKSFQSTLMSSNLLNK